MNRDYLSLLVVLISLAMKLVQVIGILLISIGLMVDLYLVHL